MKKVLSFVLILALVLSSFSMAFAGSATELKNLSDVSGTLNEEAIEVNYDLGIITGNPDGTFQPEKAVTRAEFAAMITRALAIPQSALAGYANTSFKDTSGYSWAVPYLAFCNSKGIMLGDGAGNAMPGKTITVNEAVTMSLRAIGYVANSAELTGVWPSNYVTKAQELKMYNDVAKDSVGVDKANAAQIIYNTLGQQKVAVNSDGKTEKQWDIEPNANSGIVGVPTTLLSSGLNCYAPGPTVVTASDLDESLINMAKQIGKYGYIYRNDGGKGDIVAFIEESDTTLVGRFYKDGSTLKFVTTADEQSYTVNSTTAGAVLLNGSGNVVDKIILTDTEIGAVEVMSGAKTMHQTTEFAISVDVTGKTIKQVYGVNAWVADQADQIDKAGISDITEDQSLLDEDFALTDNDEIDYTKFSLVGAKSLKDIAEDNIVYVYATGGDIIKVEVGTQTAEGIIKNYKSAKSDVATTFAIGANNYKNSAEVANGDAVDGGTMIESNNVSDEVKVFLDARGYVYDFENVSKADNYAVVERSNFGGSGSVADQAKLVLADGTSKTFNYDNDAKKAGNLEQISLIGYGLNSAGEVVDANHNYAWADTISLGSKNTISKMTTGAIGGGGKVATTGAVNTSGAAFTQSNITQEAIGNAKIADDCVVFTYDEAKSKTNLTDFDVTSIGNVETGANINNVILLFDEDNAGNPKYDKVVAMIIPDTMAKGGDKNYAVVNEKNHDANDDGDKVWRAIGFMDGKKLDALTDDQTSFNSWNQPVYSAGSAGNAGNLGSATVYEVRVDANGVITKGDDINGLTGEQYSLKAFTVASADSRKSVVVSADAPTDATGSNVASGDRYALSADVVIYQVTTDNEYKVYNGNLKDGDCVKLFDTDKKEDDGFEVVLFYRQ